METDPNAAQRDLASGMNLYYLLYRNLHGDLYAFYRGDALEADEEVKVLEKLGYRPSPGPLPDNGEYVVLEGYPLHATGPNLFD